jgi:glycerophosphoryl diester phosphodiesterase
VFVQRVLCETTVGRERELRSNEPHADHHRIGVISSGVPIGMFDHLSGVDFISLDYNIVCEDIVEMFHKRNRKVYAWTMNAPEMQHYMIDKCSVDGIIYDIFDS